MIREYIREGYDVELYEDDFNAIINSYELVNVKVAKLANYMATVFPKLPYFWGGGHNLTKDELLGLDPEWGSLKEIIDFGNDNYLVGEHYPKSFDCSGFVIWCLVNCQFNLDNYITNLNADYSLNSDEFIKLGVKYKMNNENIINIVKLGDLAIKEGHVGIITNIDKDKEIIDVVHVASDGKGVNLTSISLITGRVVDDYLGPMPQNTNLGRIGNVYFTDIISINY